LGKLKSQNAFDFPNLIDHRNNNRKRKHLYPLVEDLNPTIANKRSHDEIVFLIDQFRFLFVRLQDKNAPTSIKNTLRLSLIKAVLH